MYQLLNNTIHEIENKLQVNDERKKLLQPLVDYILQKAKQNSYTNLNFICTHNSRRSHLCQVWAQVAAAHYNIQNLFCYSGGTLQTAMFYKIVETLSNQGFEIFKLSENDNPIYAIKYDGDSIPIIGFSKNFDSLYNPSTNFAAIMTCTQADEGCPYIAGAEKRIPITYDDPKISDNTPQQNQVYAERSLQIAAEMFYVFSQIKR
jgi:arsenate reductase